MSISGPITSATLDQGPRDTHDQSRILALLFEAILDSNDEADEHAGLMGIIKEEVECPFPAKIDEEEVECLGFQCPQKGYGMHAVCKSRKKGKTYVVDVERLRFGDAKPKGYEWIEAYFAWRSMQD